MTAASHLDRPTESDWIRLRAARACARAEMMLIDEEGTMRMRAAFRVEIGTVVRSASPFLISLLATEGVTLDDLAVKIEPQHGWPRRPRLSRYDQAGSKADPHRLRHQVANLRRTEISTPPLHGHSFDLARGGRMRLVVTDHSLEVSGSIGQVHFETRFGELFLSLGECLPEVVFIGCIGGPVEDVVDHASLWGRGWRIDEIRDAVFPDTGQMLVVATGSVPYRLPWARDDAAKGFNHDWLGPPSPRRPAGSHRR